MHWFIHGGTGVLAANYWPERPELALAVSFTSHYLLDWLPHKDPGIATTRTKWGSPEVREFLTVSLPDFVFTAALGILLPWLLPPMPVGLTTGCVLASVLPDVLDGIAKLTGFPPLQWHLAFHNWAHYDHYRHPVHWGWNLFIHWSLFTILAIAAGLAIRHNGITLAH